MINEEAVFIYSCLSLNSQGLHPEFALNVDCNVLLATVTRHGVHNHALRLIDSSSTNWPNSFTDRLAQVARVGRQYGLLQSHQLINICSSFEDAGIRSIPFKGVTLSRAIYGDSTFKISSDLDILVHPDNLDKCTDILCLLGYKRVFRTSSRKEHKDLKFVHSVHRVCLELHTRLMQKSVFPDFPESSLWKGAILCNFFGREIWQLNTVDYFYYLCLHALCDLNSGSLKSVADLFAYLHAQASPSTIIEQILTTPRFHDYKGGVLFMVQIMNKIAASVGHPAFDLPSNGNTSRLASHAFSHLLDDLEGSIPGVFWRTTYIAKASSRPIRHFLRILLTGAFVHSEMSGKVSVQASTKRFLKLLGIQY